ncbi:hypothetical protein ACIRFH_02560 [Streptomyces sp. NPDC093586]|uniref:hypothetical protein n=1 Tax=Streptomyces sp. NPDC093586 TaxID=3366042 RepID=UPI00382B08EA
MLRHDVQPGRLVAGAFLTATAVIYAGDAGALWETPWFVIVPVVVGGLCLAGAVGVLTRAVRRRRRTLRTDPATDPDGTRADLTG